MDAGLVDGIDRGAGIRISGKECTLGQRMKFHGLRKKADAVHSGHALIRKKKGNGIVAGFEFAQRGYSGAARVGAHDAVAVPITAAQIPLDGAQDFRVVVDRKQDWFWHTPQMN